MPRGWFYEEDFRVLTPEAFNFVLSNELKRAVRSQNFLTLVVLTAEPERPRKAAPDPAPAGQEIPRLIGPEIRETDLLARTGPDDVSLVLLDADMESSLKVIDRVMARLDHYQFPAPLAITVGAACCPTHASDPESLRQEAAARPVRRRRHGQSGQPSSKTD